MTSAKLSKKTSLHRQEMTIGISSKSSTVTSNNSHGTHQKRDGYNSRSAGTVVGKRKVQQARVNTITSYLAIQLIAADAYRS